ncbi:helix-turn-helix domain-containing protein [Neobacillus vireti]|uniref:XRE family transcriptional regulator n=1 Tax=Neobacillus vireti LMG 21834 TaxID=1131730 RepID=A0AB94IKB0_9BACI|nr:helix-turn-helix transcriptional regulator [Neobacillus vireti]ETI67475.1 XRE family transcriptional regulator [Neobacillus vireti LMG 21834]KLT15523.1 hypothetical protein AA980_23015 [Neobacillus vireti]
MSLADKLKELRDNQNWSQKTLAKMMNLHRSKISRIETGKVIPDYQTLVKFAEVFKIEKDYLVMELDQQNRKPEEKGFVAKESLEDPELVMISQLFEKEPELKKHLVELHLLPPRRRAFYVDLIINTIKVNQRHPDKM